MLGQESKVSHQRQNNIEMLQVFLTYFDLLAAEQCIYFTPKVKLSIHLVVSCCFPQV